MSGYLNELTLRLAIGATGLDPHVQSLHSRWIQTCQREDGGFAGREGESDPYYTAFALRSLWVLGSLDEQVAARAGVFLRGRMKRRDSVIDLISLIFAAAILELAAGEIVIADEDQTWRENVAKMLASLRCEDGGFAKSPEGRAGSTYQTFLSVLCHELMEVPVPDVAGIERFLRSQRHPEGGYLEIRVAKRAGVNPTAAAVGTLKTLGRLNVAQESETIDFLLDMQSDDGGLTANTRIPFADLLSSFTGLTTLVDLGAAEQLSLPRLLAYAQSMQSPEGGFIGFVLDQTPDVEYSFYGVSTMAMVTGLIKS